MDKLLKAWERPQLIVLAKSTPEESVLTQCKTQNPNIITVGPADKELHAECASGSVTACNNCLSRAMGGT
jgi:hypothetical protein